MAGSGKTPRKPRKAGQSTGPETSPDTSVDTQSPDVPAADMPAADIAQPGIDPDTHPPAPRLEKTQGAVASDADTSKIVTPETEPAAPAADPVQDQDASAADPVQDKDLSAPDQTPVAAAAEHEPIPDTPAETQPDIAEAARVKPVATTADPAPRRQGGALALLLGGALAASAGFLAAQYTDPRGWPFAVGDAAEESAAAQAGRIDSLAERIDSFEAQIAALQSDVAGADARSQAAVAEAVAPVDARMTQSLSEGDARIDALGAAVDALAGRVTEVEKMPIDANAAAEAAVAAYERELASIRAEIDEVIARNDALQSQIDDARAETQSAERLSAARVALGQIEAALENGGGYAAAVRNILATGAEVPAPLADHATSGVPSRTALITTFAPAARAALDAALRDVADLGTGDRLWSFVRAQVGARSLAARDGDGADAILSRAEAALRAGDLDAALAEIAALPDEPGSHMSAWVAQAEIRRAALAAMPALSTNIASL